MTIRKSFILEHNPPIDNHGMEAEMRHLNKQYMVAVALTANPVVLDYIIEQAEDILFQLSIAQDQEKDPTSYKIKVEKQKSALSVYKHLYSLAHTKDEIEQTIRRNTPQQ